MNKVNQKTPRYFNLFKTQHEFYSATLSEDFFNLNIPQYLNTWKATRKGCLRLLLSHYDCPSTIRDKFIVHPQVEVRFVAFFGYIANTKFGSNIQYVLDNEKLILQDRAKTIRTTFLQHYAFIKLIKFITSQPNFSLERLLLNFPSDNIGEVFTVLNDNIDLINIQKQQISEYIALLLNHKDIFSFKQTLTLQDLILFLLNPTSGLISSDPLVRELTFKYFKNQKTYLG